MDEFTFKYDPLPNGSIRLLTLAGTNQDGLMGFNLETTELTRACNFYALSYVWGSEFTGRSVCCNNGILKVTQNLHDALAALQGHLKDDQTPIWIDAICINQTDNFEKARQVPCMCEIYRTAKTVLVWLGTESLDSALAMDHIEIFAKVLPDLEQPPLWADLEQHGLPDQDDPIWKALGHLFRRPWFGRVWAFQESVLASSIKVLCGDRSVDWAHLSQTGSDLKRTGLSVLTNYVERGAYHAANDGLRAVGLVSWAVRFMKWKSVNLAKDRESNLELAEAIAHNAKRSYIPLSLLLLASESKLCSDPRDRVYGMLSLTSRDFRKKIPLSYTEDVHRLYLETGKACIDQEKSLTYLQLLAGRPRLPGLPTWCAGFELSRTREELAAFQFYLRAGYSVKDLPLPEAEVQTFADKDYIEVAGFRGDKIDRVLRPPENFNRNRLKRLVWLERCGELARTIQVKFPNTDVRTSLAYTVTANTVGRAPDSEALRDGLDDLMRCDKLNLGDPTGEETHRPMAERIPMFTDVKRQMGNAIPGRSFFTTIKGRLGIGPPEIQTGDTIVVMFGAGPVFVLRESQQVDSFDFVGDAFVHGLMELDRTPENEIGKKETFRIV